MGKKPGAKKTTPAKSTKTAKTKKKTTRPKAKKTKTSSSTKVARKTTATKKTESLKAEKVATKPTCKIKSCKRLYRAKGYCSTHYKLWRQGKYGKTRFKRCGQDECNQPMALNRFGFCESHYQSRYVKGEKPVAPEPAEDKKVAEEKKEETAAEAS